MALLVEGQMKFLRYVSSFSETSHSVTSQNMRKVIQSTGKMQNLYPDTISAKLNVSPTIESDTGKVVSRVG